MKKMIMVFSALCLATSGHVMAEIYAGGKVGGSWLDDACRSTDTCDDDSFGAGIFVGYQIWDQLALEAGYDYLGNFSGAGLDDDPITVGTLAPKLNFPINEDFSIYAKAGLGIVSFDGSNTDLSYLGAVGGEYQLQRNLALRVEYQLLTDMNNDIVRSQGNMVTLGLSYRFGQHEEQPVAPVETVAEPEVMPETVVESKPEKPEEMKILKKQLSSESTFMLNSAELTSQAKSSLQEVVDVMLRYPQSQVMITGYTDTTGTTAYNQSLSEQRAQAVADYLASKGIESGRISAKGMGESDPIASNETRAGREQNRRVEIEIPTFEYQVVDE
jgi:OOP family OmpA-OmpF porin